MRNQPCCTTGLSPARSEAEGREVGEVVYRGGLEKDCGNTRPISTDPVGVSTCP